MNAMSFHEHHAVHLPVLATSLIRVDRVSETTSKSSFSTSKPTSRLSTYDHDDDEKEKVTYFQKLILLITSFLSWVKKNTYDRFKNLVRSLVNSLHTLPFFRAITKRYRNLESDSKEKILFMLSSTIGTIFFVVVFEHLYYIFQSLSTEKMVVNANGNITQVKMGMSMGPGSRGVIVLAYIISYVFSILLQHSLNRFFLFGDSPYWISLFQTYLVYSVSLCCILCFSVIGVERWKLSPRMVSLLSLPTSGVLNFYFLRCCLQPLGHPNIII